ncbi:MAG: nuclear transport factor 2 family protein [Myxococcales bacterium]|nr:nuclear transport factor 2 family protein [Myxococcales bacterium]HIK84078.1 nuclear transport factor 2 family protein [Myxococcales bacterium]
MTATAQNLSNQDVADAIISMYRSEPVEIEWSDLIADDVVGSDWLHPGLEVRGATDFTELFFEKSAKAFPDATEEVLDTIFDGRTLMVNARFRSTFAAEYYGIEAHGGSVTYEIIDRWVIESGKVVRVKFAANTREAHQQLTAGSN